MKNAAKTKETLLTGLLTLYFVLCLSFLACAGEAAFSLPDSKKIQTTLHSSVRSLGLQTQLPAGNKKIAAEDRLPDRSFSRLDSRVSTIARALLFCSLAAIVIVILKTWRDNLWSSSRARRFEQSVDENAPAAGVITRMGKAQVEADELARQGKFAEAMHTILLRSVDELRHQLSVSIAVSLTSREILRHVKLPSEGHDLFADIINRVEISYFGGRCPAVDDYRACRSSFDSLTGVLLRYSVRQR